MTKLAHLAEDGRTVAAFPALDPALAAEGFKLADCYHEDYLAACIEVDDAAQVGWLWDGKVATAPVAPAVDLRAYAAAARYARETAGVTVSGVKVATDEASQAKIGNAYVLLQASGSPSIDFKGSDGAFATLTADQFKGLALAVGAHVQACFAKEAEVADGIAKGTVKTVADVDSAFATIAA